MKSKIRTILNLAIVLAIFFSLTIGLSKEVQAATCTWEGDDGPDWSVALNWSCEHVPVFGDDVVIPNQDVDPIINALTTGVDVNSISIESDAVLTVNATSYGLLIYTASTFTNNGEIIINGVNDGTYGLGINSPSFANDGTVTINSGYLSLVRGGTHTGDFVGEPGTVLSFSNQWPDQIWNFTADSLIQVPIIILGSSGSTLNISGEFSPGLVLDNDSRFTMMQNTTVNLNTLNILMPVEVQTYGSLNLPDIALDIQNLEVGGIGGQLQNTQTLNIINTLELKGGTLVGAGDIIVPSTASSIVIRGNSTVSGKALENNTSANWITGNITLSDGAIFVNNGTFTANGTISVPSNTMTGTSPASFINNGEFIKDTADTITTMNIPFINYGSIEVAAGELIFQQGIQNGDDVVIDLGGGTLDPGDTLTLSSDDSLIGSGSLSANLVNGGSVSPGASPGTITVIGDYTQESTGTLDIELGGTTAGIEYDQLIVTGTATMAGTLNVSLIDEYSPQLGDSFTILPYGTRSGGFTTLNLPEGYRWGTNYGHSGYTLTVLEGGSIHGTVACDSTHTVFVDLYMGDADPPPDDTTQITCGDSYSFDDLSDGTYYVGAWIDLNESGGGPPDDGEPYAWYGEPTAVTIIDGETKTDIDITIEGGGHTLFLPLILH